MDRTALLYKHLDFEELHIDLRVDGLGPLTDVVECGVRPRKSAPIARVTATVTVRVTSNLWTAALFCKSTSITKACTLTCDRVDSAP